MLPIGIPTEDLFIVIIEDQRRLEIGLIEIPDPHRLIAGQRDELVIAEDHLVDDVVMCIEVCDRRACHKGEDVDVVVLGC